MNLARVIQFVAAAMPSMFIAVPLAHADVFEFENTGAWIDAVGEFTFIDFVGLPKDQMVTDEFLDLGIIFTRGTNFGDQVDAFPDGAGLVGAPVISIQFLEPQAWIAVDYPSEVVFSLLLDGQLVHEASFHAPPATIAFAGLVSDELFDQVLIGDAGTVYIDNLYFGVPAPGSLSAAVLVLLSTRSRGRRHHIHSRSQ